MLTNAPLAGALTFAKRFGLHAPQSPSVLVDGVAPRGHDGVDLQTPPGTPVQAVQNGQVLGVYPDHPRLGQTIVLAHEWGQTIYAQLKAIQVNKGAETTGGQTIGLSGGAPDVPHLHFGMRIQPFDLSDEWAGCSDPEPYLNRLTQPHGAILGPHIIGGVHPHLDLLRQWQPRLITVLDPNPDEMAILRQVCPKAVIVGRIFVADSDVESRVRANPEAAAEWAHDLTMRQLTPHVNYWQISNEIMAGAADLPLLARFEIRRMQLAATTIYFCAILAFAVGNPDLPEADRMALWRMLYPALELAEQGNHVVAVHQYGAPDLWKPFQDWYGYRLEHQILRRLPFKNLQFAVTEYGIDGMIQSGVPHGWQAFTDANGYAEQLIRSGRYLERFSGRVLGYSVFTLGHNNPWQSYDIAGPVAQRLAQESPRGTWNQVKMTGTEIQPGDSNNSSDLDATVPAGPSSPSGPSAKSGTGGQPSGPSQPTAGKQQPVTTGGTTPMTTTLTRRATNWFDDLHLSIKTLNERPDHPSADVVYVIKDVFTTRNGTWDVTSDKYAAPQWAADSYLKSGVFQKAFEKNNLYAAVIGQDGQFMSGQEILFWTGGIDKLADLGNTTTAVKNAWEQPGWATLLMFPDSNYDAGSGQSGPWCWTPNGLPAEVLCGGGLPNGESVSTFVVWQAVKKDDVINPPGPTPTPPPTPGPTPTPTPGPTPSITRRVGRWVNPMNLSYKRVEDRPDHPQADQVVYMIKDVFTTRDGSWEQSSVYGGVDQWARDTYLKPFGDPEYFDDAGADHHLFGAVLDLEGKLIKNLDILYWSDGFAKLGDSNYDGYAVGSLGFRYPRTKDRSGWANIPMDPGSSYVPERGESGPWCWVPVGLPAEVMCGGGMPAKQHISTFVVWQAVPVTQVPKLPPTGDHFIFLPTVLQDSNPPGASSAPSSAPPRPQSTLPESPVAEIIRAAGWNRLGFDYKRGAILAEYARRVGLGAPVTQVFETAGHLAQGYVGGIAIASLNALHDVKHLPW